MNDAVTSAADFSGMKDNSELYIDQIYHKTFIAMSDKGIEASAATAVSVAEYAAPGTVRLDVDRPYLYVVYDVDSKAPLFLGQVYDPTKD